MSPLEDLDRQLRELRAVVRAQGERIARLEAARDREQDQARKLLAQLDAHRESDLSGLAAREAGPRLRCMVCGEGFASFADAMEHQRTRHP